MPRNRPTRRLTLAWIVTLAASSAFADEPPLLSVGQPRASTADDRPPLPPLRSGETAQASPDAGSGGWWLGPTGVVVALGAFGALAWSNRRAKGPTSSGPLQVVGRVTLAPRQSAVLLRAGDRTLIVGVGPQGAPTLLGELPPTPGREGGRA